MSRRVGRGQRFGHPQRWRRHALQPGYPIFCEVEVNPSSLKEENLKLKWNFREADWEGFRKDVDQSVEGAVPRSRKWKLTRRVTFFEDAVLGAAKRHVGIVRAKGSGRC